MSAQNQISDMPPAGLPDGKIRFYVNEWDQFFVETPPIKLCCWVMKPPKTIIINHVGTWRPRITYGYDAPPTKLGRL